MARPRMTDGDLRHGRHCVFALHVHLVFVTKFRRNVFKAEHLKAMQAILASVCKDFEAELVEFNHPKFPCLPLSPHSKGSRLGCCAKSLGISTLGSSEEVCFGRPLTSLRVAAALPSTSCASTSRNSKRPIRTPAGVRALDPGLNPEASRAPGDEGRFREGKHGWCSSAPVVQGCGWGDGSKVRVESLGGLCSCTVRIRVLERNRRLVSGSKELA